VTALLPDITVEANPPSAYRAAAGAFQRACAEAADARGVFRVALSGGSTPEGLYSLMATDESFRSAVAWERIEFFWSDERHVPPDHPESNYRMAQDALLSRVPIEAHRVHRVRTEQPDASVAAILYEFEIRRVFNSYGDIPSFDLILLGLGSDGHTASLFPGTPALHEGVRLVAANHVKAVEADRITMTFPLLNAAQLVMFVVTGAGKAAAVRDVLQPGPGTPELPARMVRPDDGRLLWIMDKAAAALLTGG
jgi:6-phosphogluconolactonase